MKPEHVETAETILGKAIDDLMAIGLEYDTACHSLIKMGLDSLPGGVCRQCLPGHYEAIIGAAEAAIAEIDDLVPGRDVALSPSCARH